MIPDDWRADVLHKMADKLNIGGKMLVNVRGAETIKNQGKEGVTKVTLDDPSEILVKRPDGSIRAYQKALRDPSSRVGLRKSLAMAIV